MMAAENQNTGGRSRNMAINDGWHLLHDCCVPDTALIAFYLLTLLILTIRL